MIGNRLSRALFRSIDIQAIPDVDVSLMSSNHRNLVRRRKRSIEMYSYGTSHKEIFRLTGRNRQEVAEDVGRFMTRDRNGTILGWSALIPGRRVRPENPDSARNKKRRKNAIFARGTFTKLLATYPAIKIGLDNLICGRTPDGKTRDKVIAPGEIHAGFIELCRQAGLTNRDYPLVTEDRGRRALSDYRGRLLAEKPNEVLSALYGKDAERELRTGTGREQAIPRPTRFYQRIEIDGHELPFCGAIELPGANPFRPILKAMSAITLVFVVEWGSACILGHSVRYGKNYSSRDTLRAVRKAILPWRPLELDPRLGIKYPDGYGQMDEQQWVLWTELHFDNFMAHLSPFLIAQLPASVPIASPRAAPNTHAVVESVNGVIDRMFKDLSCGTAAGRAEAAAEAERLGLTCEIVEQIIDVAVATYNSTPPSGSTYSKIELLQRYVSDPRSLIARIPESVRPRFKLYDFEAVLPVRGTKRKTRSGPGLTRPFIHLHHGDYTSVSLAGRFDLIGQNLIVRGESDDLRFLDCWLEDGSPIDRVHVLGPWALSKHGFETRSAADKLRRQGVCKFGENPVQIVISSLQEIARTDSRAASLLAMVLQESDIRLSATGVSVPDQNMVSTSAIVDPFPELGTFY